ncbi:MAG: hypothetical protein PHI71_06000, partial [Acidiphilium sp.]|nr:hypothetical protein [Acidiphilium sp.]
MISTVSPGDASVAVAAVVLAAMATVARGRWAILIRSPSGHLGRQGFLPHLAGLGIRRPWNNRAANMMLEKLP